MQKKIILTGANGLIGRELLPLLVQGGYEVHVITTKKSINCENIFFHTQDLFDSIQIHASLALIKADYLIHCAWPVTGTFNDNVNFRFISASLNLLDAFAQNGGKRAIMAGTSLEYSSSMSNIKETQTHETPCTRYGQCKKFFNNIAQLYCESNNVSYGWGRIFSAFGHETDERRLTLAVIKKLSNDEEIVIRSGSLLRDYIYSKDVAAALVAFLESDVQGNVNICSGIETSIHDFVMAIARKMNKEHLVVFDEIESNQQKRAVGDNTRLSQEIGYAIQYSLSSALDDIFSVMKI